MAGGRTMAPAAGSNRLSRRRFAQSVGVAGLGVLAGCGRLPWQGQSSPPKSHRIGWLTPESRASTGSSPLYDALQEGLRELGYVEGQNLVVDARYAEGQAERASDLVAELISLQP